MKRAIPYIGSLGLGALVVGFLLWLFQPERDRIWASLLIAGLILIVFYLGSQWREVMTLLGRRGARYGANVFVLTLIVVVILGLVNYLANRHNKRWDLTESQQYTLSDQTRRIVSNLDRDLRIVLFDRPERAAAARDLLDLYEFASPNIDVEVIDQEAEPARAMQYQTATEGNIPFGTVIVDAGEKVERVSTAAEQDITNAIIKVLKEGTKKIYFVEGHGEKDPDEPSTQGLSFVKTKLEESNYEIEKFHPLQAMQEARILLPEDAAAIVIAGPKRDYLPAEIDALRDYLRAGGKAIFLLDPENQGPKPNLVAFMGEYGVELGDNVIIDASGVGQLFGFGPEVPLVSSYSRHAITERFTNLATVYPFVRSLETASPTPEGVSVTTLFESSESSWAEKNLDELAQGRVRPDEDEQSGPLTLAVTMTIQPASSSEEGEAVDAQQTAGEDDEPAESEAGNEEEEEATPEGRAVVVGDSDFIANSLAQAPIGNLDLFLNMVNWVAEDEDLISIRPREAEDRRVTLNQQQQSNVGYLSLLIIPAVILFLGISVWWGRR